MTTKDEEQLKHEIQHIFDSGANEIRVFEMVKRFIERRDTELYRNDDNSAEYMRGYKIGYDTGWDDGFEAQ